MKLLDEALLGPNAKEWQAALDYKIGQLEKLCSWVIKDLPKGHSAIPYGEVLKVKRGPERKPKVIAFGLLQVATGKLKVLIIQRHSLQP